jgi:hypothetical protein
MSLLPFAEWLASTPGSIALHESLFMYPVVESAHVLTLCLFVGMAFIWDLRLLGLILPNVPMSDMNRRVWPFMFVGFILMSITGVLLFYAIPIRSYQSVWFRMKVIFLIAAAVNVWFFHNHVYRSIADWDTRTPPYAAKRAAVISLLLWAGIIVSGRMIAYNWFDCDLQQSPFINFVAGCKAKEG